MLNSLQMICEIERPDSGFIKVSDRNIVVGDSFYEARVQFPPIRRTVGEWLSGELEFSTLSLELNNADERYNDILPGGASFDTWINNTVELKLGIRDQSSTYFTIFKGRVTDIGGLARTTSSIRIVARDDFDKLNQTFPTVSLRKGTGLGEYEFLEDSIDGTLVPTIYGDWSRSEVDVDGESRIIPAYVLNGADPAVTGGARDHVQCIIASHALEELDLAGASSVRYVRGGDTFGIDNVDIINIAGDNSTFEIDQRGPGYLFEAGDLIFCAVRGKDLGTSGTTALSLDNNVVSQAKDILKTYGGAIDADFDSNWDTFRDVTTPAANATSAIKSRVWAGSENSAIAYALSLLEQIRLEAFISRDLKIKINSLRLQDYKAPGSTDLEINNFDFERGSLVPEIDVRNNFNRAQSVYNLLPDDEEQFRGTIYKNTDAITAANGKAISKEIAFPNLWVADDVNNQLQEMLRLSGGYIEIISSNFTWRSTLLDIGDYVEVDINIGGIQYDGVPMMIRDIGYDSEGMKIPIKLWSLQMIPFPGYAPGYSGTTGGTTATIEED